MKLYRSSVKPVAVRLACGVSLLALAGLQLASCSDQRSSGNEEDSDNPGDTGDDASGSSDDTQVSSEESSADSTTKDDSDASSDDAGDDLPKFDLDAFPDFPDKGGDECSWTHEPCDKSSSEVEHAIGLNCPGEVEVTVTFKGDKSQVWVTDQPLGSATPKTYPILEGSKMVVLSSGTAKDIIDSSLHTASTPFTPEGEALDMPAPISVTPVKGDCLKDPSLVGTGDCSKTLEAQWNEAGDRKGNDWAEIRITAKVPENIHGLSFDFAFFSVEYPVFYKQPFNDLFVAWLESNKWTGNISFDDKGSPISLNAGYLDYKDAPNPYDCPEPCKAPELAGTALQGHGATRWLTTKAPVEPGEEITLVLGIVDLADDILDSMVLLDNFRWECLGGDPTTDPKFAPITQVRRHGF